MLTLFVLGLIYHYEGKVKEITHNLEAMTRRFHIAKKAVLDTSMSLDDENKALQKQIEVLKMELAEGDGSYWSKMYHEAIKPKESDFQFESHAYQPKTWSKEIYGDKPYVNPWNNTAYKDYQQDDLDFDQ